MIKLFGDKIGHFLKTRTRAVISTLDAQNKPYTSVIFYVLDSNDELHFITKSQTAKFENLKVNSNAAITVFDPVKPIAVNMTGEVVEVIDVKERDRMMQEVFKVSNDELQDYAPIIKLSKGSFALMKFIPKQAKMSDFTKPMVDAEEVLKDY